MRRRVEEEEEEVRMVRVQGVGRASSTRWPRPGRVRGREGRGRAVEERRWRRAAAAVRPREWTETAEEEEREEGPVQGR